MRFLSLLLALLCSSAALAQPLGTAFVYQGELQSAGTPTSAPHDVRFSLWDAPSGGAQLGPTLCLDSLTPTAGRFAATLDFGPIFTGQRTFLQLEVRATTGLPCANTSGFISLFPRTELTLAPNAAFALLAASATNALQFNGQPPAFYADASNLSAGTIPDARLSTNVANLNGTQSFSGSKTFNSIPAFRGGTSGSTPPFQVDSTFLVSNLNADLLDGQDSTDFAPVLHGHSVNDISGVLPVTKGGTGASSAAAALTSLGASGLAANNTFTGSNSFISTTNFASVIANSYAFGAPVTRYRSLHHSAFRAATSNMTYGGVNFIEATSSSSVIFHADLDIPDGAVITSIAFSVFDNDAARDITVAVLTQGTGSFSPTAVTNGSTTSTGSNAFVAQTLTVTPSSLTNTPISRAILLRATWDGAAGTNIRLLGARVTYTISAPLP